MQFPSPVGRVRSEGVLQPYEQSEPPSPPAPVPSNGRGEQLLDGRLPAHDPVDHELPEVGREGGEVGGESGHAHDQVGEF